MFKTVLVLLFLVAAVFAEEAYFAFVTHGTEKEFIFKLTNDLRIKEARGILDGSITDLHIVLGRIKRKPAPYNSNYSFHLDPDTISFVAQAMEICDLPLSFVEDNLEDTCGTLLPGCIYCPWTTKLTREVKFKYYWKN